MSVPNGFGINKRRPASAGRSFYWRFLMIDEAVISLIDRLPHSAMTN
jgi:hypothetical protein